VCSFNIPYLRRERRGAVKRVGRNARLITCFFRAPNLEIVHDRVSQWGLAAVQDGLSAGDHITDDRCPVEGTCFHRDEVQRPFIESCSGLSRSIMGGGSVA
jgi:hypothetical protein